VELQGGLDCAGSIISVKLNRPPWLGAYP
jgi:hypothetical protein